MNTTMNSSPPRITKKYIKDTLGLDLNIDCESRRQEYLKQTAFNIKEIKDPFLLKISKPELFLWLAFRNTLIFFGKRELCNDL